MNPFLKTVELPYRGLNRLRRALYRAGVLRAKRLPQPVISVGNLAAGGSGKTPTVIALARFLVEHGLRVAVLTRGYGRSGTGGAVTELDAAQFGDEPVLIKRNVPQVQVIVGSNRHQNGLSINCDVYLLDDGFQHLQLHRDLDLVIEAPASVFHREGPSALRDADIVIRRNLQLNMPKELRGKRLFAFAGLANNEQFFESLQREGLEVAGRRGFPDHHRYTPDDLVAIHAEAARVRAERIVTTEKDAVKLGDDAIISVPALMLLDPAVLDRVLETARGGTKS